MKSLLKVSYLRQAVFTAGFIAQQCRTDADAFARNVVQRLKHVQIVGPLLQCRALQNRDNDRQDTAKAARHAFESGNFSEAIDLLSGSRRYRLTRQRYEFEQAKLHQGIESSLPLRGAERVFHYLTNSLPHTSAGYSLRSHAVLRCMQSAGIQVAAVTRYGYPNIVGKLAANGHEKVDGVDYFRILPLWPSGSFFTQQDRAVKQLVRYAGKFGAEVLHTTTGFENALIVSRAAKRLGIPWVYEMRGAPEQTWLSRQPTDKRETAKQSEYYQAAHRQELEAARQAAAVVVLSEITKRSLTERGISAEKIVVAPNGVPDEVFQRRDSKLELRRELSLPEGKTLVGAITAVVDYEGLEYFLEALTDLDESFCGVVVGDGVALEGLKKHAQALGIEQRARFVGRQPANSIHKWYGALDVFVVPRKDIVVCRNVTPIKSVMAQALDIPVVASDLPALREVTGGIETYVAPESALSLAEGIRVAASLEHNEKRILWARTRAWSAVAQEYSALYRQ
ncbi:glycosyltransferase family 4 protein [Corynebacterium sp. NML130628]|uniref:glycosyltransferase family 4 protein n=1 Tax=Corynebacterium sp. NML130628 TaxID=1906333 RepID=UPI0008FB8B72|nr:glycosyltransferase family 4 protein [Corynebacterium sp. NML130628]OIR45758.1 hypothetical protein BJP07_02525 [Corynebacterium sp. NML130628]